MSQSTTKDTKQDTTPWAQQIPYLDTAFQTAQTNLNNANGNQYSGNMIAGLTPEQMNTFGSMLNFSNTSGAPGYSNNAADAALDTAANLDSTGAGYNSTAGGLYNLGASTAMQGNRTANMGVRDLSNTYGQLNNFTPTGNTGSNIDAATQYANNPAISGMVDASMRDATRNATENQLPGIARTAAATGNLGSSKRGLAEGVVSRGIMDQTADTSANLRGQAYTQGLNLAENARQFNNNASLDALKSSGSIAGNIAQTGLGQTGAGISAANAGTAAGGLGLGYAGASQNAIQQGLAANDQALTQQAGLYGLGQTAGTGLQAGNQAQLDNARSMIEYANQNPSSNLAQFMQIIGGQQWGGSTTGTENSTMTQSPLTVLAGLAASGAAIGGGNGFNLFGKK